MDANLLAAIVFTVGCIMIYMVKIKILNTGKSWELKDKDFPDDFNVNNSFLINTISVIVILIASMVYEGCSNSKEQELKLKYESVDKFLKQYKEEAKEEVLYDLRQKMINNN